jgi:CarD family transcriptional regulator
MFNINDVVFYPGHGVAKIADVVERTVSGTVVRLNKLDFLFKENNSVLVAEHSMQGLGVRYLSCESLVDEAFSELWRPSRFKVKGAFDFSPSAWSRRQKEYQLKIHGGSLVEMAGVYRDIMTLASSKELAFGEKNTLRLVEELLVQEVSFVKHLSRESVIEVIKKPFRESGLTTGFVDVLSGAAPHGVIGSSSAI